MQLGNTVHFNSFKWVKEELRQLLLDVQRRLEAYVNDPQDAAKLDEIVTALRQVRGTLSLVEVYGAALLAEEMEQVARALREGQVANRDNAFEVLLGAAIKLPDYLDALATGQRDVPLVLLPLLNDLRAARNASLLSENVLFFPDLSAPAPIDRREPSGEDPQALARKARHAYQLGLLGWFRGQDVPKALKRMHKVLERLCAASGDTRARRYWWIAQGLVEALQNGAVEGGVAVKSLLGRVDRQIKRLADEGEAGFAAALADDAFKNLLYYLARAQSDEGAVGEIKRTFELERYLPSDRELASAQRRLSAPNRELLERVAAAIAEDMALAKDTMEAYLQGDRGDLSGLEPLPPLYTKIADTLGMLGLGRARESLLFERGQLQAALERGEPPGEDTLMGAAATLLSVEDELATYVERRTTGEDTAVEEAGGGEADADEARARAERRRVIASLVNEALKSLAVVKDAYLDHLAQPDVDKHLAKLPDTLRELAGAMFVDPLDSAQGVLAALAEYFADDLIPSGRLPEAAEQDTFADVVTNIECFLEAVAENRVDAELYVTAAEEALARLRRRARGEPDAARTLDDAAKAEVELLDEAEGPVEELVIEDVDLEPEAEPEAEPAPPPRPRAPLVKDYGQLQVIGEDADEEIIDIFIEEALEELERISGLFPQWRDNPADREALTTIRRSFHTLKGSGRLIGATLIGEFAWAFENLLNRIIDGTLRVSPVILDTVEEAIAVLPQLIEQIRGNRQPVDNVFELMEAADRLAAGETAEPARPKPSEPATADAGAGEDDTLIDAGETGEETVIELVDAPDPMAAAADEPAGDEGETFELGDLIDEDEIDEQIVLEDIAPERDAGGAGRDEGFAPEPLVEPAAGPATDAARPPASEPEGAPAAETRPVPEASPEPTGADAAPAAGDDVFDLEADLALLEIFSEEAEGHLRTIEVLMAKARDGALASKDNEALIRALHTLHGSARTAKYTRIADAARLLETHANNLQQLGEPWTAPALDLLAEAVGYVRACVAHLREHTSELRDVGDLFDRLTALAEESTRQVEARGGAVREATGSARIEDLDPELIEIFLEEAPDIIGAIEQNLQRWRESGFKSEYITEIMRQLHTLKGSARMASLGDVGDLAHTLESLFIAVADNKLPTSEAVVTMLTDAVDRLLGMMDVLAQGRVPTVSKAYLQSLEDVRLWKIEPEDTITVRVAEVERRLKEDQAEQARRAAEEGAPAALPEAPDEEAERPEAASVEGTLAPTPIESAPVAEAQAAALDEMREGVEQLTGVAPQQDLIRVRAEKLDTLVNHAGEVNIYHSRLGQYIADLNFNLNELEQTVARLQRQLRDMEIQTEAQIAWRLEREAENPYEEFDPLEMDRYSHMQQLSRALAESANDIDNLRGTLADLVQNAEFVLTQQARVGTELQEELLQTRMVKFQGLAPRLRRVVRQTAVQLNKKVELAIIGADQEIDRTIQERMLAPLEHHVAQRRLPRHRRPRDAPCRRQARGRHHPVAHRPRRLLRVAQRRRRRSRHRRAAHPPQGHRARPDGPGRAAQRS
ncbi:MAG: hypothetical protein KatS3mg121_0737 [Gammaproteobacteria bacterium]|nr:MAG: hypothetical protein KatS3mg121_0737 [Gammaproteobacteria bacterium]